MKQTEIFIVGASVSGLALAACLQKRGVEYVIIEKESQIASACWSKYQQC